MIPPALTRARREALRQVSGGLLRAYLDGFYQGSVRTLGEPAPGQWEPTVADEESADLNRAARAAGLVDGLAWESRTRAGLVRLVASHVGISRRVLAERYLARDERTIRRWVAGEQPVPEAALTRLLDLLNSGPAPA